MIFQLNCLLANFVINCDYYQIQNKKQSKEKGKIDTAKTKEAENSHIMSVRRIDPGVYGLAHGFFSSSPKIPILHEE